MSASQQEYPDLYLIAAVVTGIFVSESGRVPGAGSAQSVIEAQRGSSQWKVRGGRSELAIYADGAMSADRAIDPELCSLDFDQTQCDALANAFAAASGLEVAEFDARLLVGEHGIGVLRMAVRCEKSLDDAGVAAVRALGGADTFTEKINDLLGPAVDQLSVLLKSTEGVLLDEGSVGPVGAGVSGSRLLWMHRLFVASERSKIVEFSPANATLVDGGLDGELYVGDGSSLFRIDAVATPAVDQVVRMTSLAQGYWSVLNEFDLALVGRSRDYARQLFSRRNARIEVGDAHRMVARVSVIQHEFNSLTSTLPPQERLVWEGLWSAWRFGALESSLNSKLDTVEKLDRLSIDRADRRWQRALNRFAVVLGAAAFISTTIDVLGFGATNDPLSLESKVRLSVLVLSIAVLLIAGVWAVRRD